MDDRVSRMRLEFPGLTERESAAGLRLCLASWSAPALLGDDVESLALLLRDPNEAVYLTRKISHLGRRAESFLARLAHEECERRATVQIKYRSWSHTRARGQVVAAALGCDRAPVGVDVEAVDRLTPDSVVSKRILTESEKRSIDRLPEAQRRQQALRFWCAKESLVKALGSGLQAPLSQYEVLIEPSRAPASEDVLHVGFRHFPDWVSVVSRYRAVIVARCLPRSLIF